MVLDYKRAIESGKSFFAYRAPGESQLIYGISEGITEGLGEPGFVIGMFEPDKPIFTIPFHGKPSRNFIPKVYSMPLRSSSYDDYIHEVEEIIRDLKEGKGKKVVAARVIVKEGSLDPEERLACLCRRFPESYVFCFHTPATGCWIGASPELLLESRDAVLKSMALAGTRKTAEKADVAQPWDLKNLEEQNIVTEYILNIFRKYGFEPLPGSPYTRKTGDIEHICTEITVSPSNHPYNDAKAAGVHIEKLLKDLSPTPALCGTPKDFALKEIRRLENFDRGCYGGFCGPYWSSKNFSFNVVLRCEAINGSSRAIYVGGGITSHSDVASEWLETKLKASNIL